MTESPPLSAAQRRMVLFLRAVAVITWLAFAAAVMPESWMIEIAEELDVEPFPSAPLTFYLARNLSLLYGMLGAALWLITFDIHRYRPLVRYIALGTMAFGVGQLIVDVQSGLPWWWSVGESCSTFMGGVVVLLLDRAAWTGVTPAPSERSSSLPESS